MKSCYGEINNLFGLGACDSCSSRERCQNLVDKREAKKEKKMQEIKERARNRWINCERCDVKMMRLSSSHKRCKACASVCKTKTYIEWMAKTVKPKNCINCGKEYRNANWYYCNRSCRLAYNNVTKGEVCKNT